MQLYASTLPDGLDCPWCLQMPQAGCLTTMGDGQAYHLVCALCFRHRSFTRAKCPGCGETEEAKLVTYASPDFDHLKLKACDSCMGYLLAVDREKDIDAIPEVDELAGLPLDLWAVEKDYHKLQPNIAGV
jgi:formate dehydrogenase maturation protein FdhE